MISSPFPPPCNTLAGQDMFRYTSRNLLRIYPRGIRMDSSNYDPMEAWAVGECGRA